MEQINKEGKKVDEIKVESNRKKEATRDKVWKSSVQWRRQTLEEKKSRTCWKKGKE